MLDGYLFCRLCCVFDVVALPILVVLYGCVLIGFLGTCWFGVASYLRYL